MDITRLKNAVEALRLFSCSDALGESEKRSIRSACEEMTAALEDGAFKEEKPKTLFELYRPGPENEYEPW
jgi:hypothetical protein